MKDEKKYIEYLVRKLNSMNFYLNDVHGYNISVNNYRYFVSKFKMKYKGVEYVTPNNDMASLIAKIGFPYLGKNKMKNKTFIWRNLSWTN